MIDKSQINSFENRIQEIVNALKTSKTSTEYHLNHLRYVLALMSLVHNGKQQKCPIF